jgi:hypothetical protein
LDERSGDDIGCGAGYGYSFCFGCFCFGTGFDCDYIFGFGYSVGVEGGGGDDGSTAGITSGASCPGHASRAPSAIGTQIRRKKRKQTGWDPDDDNDADRHVAYPTAMNELGKTVERAVGNESDSESSGSD